MVAAKDLCGGNPLLTNLANHFNVSSAPLLLAGTLMICLISLLLSVGFLTPFFSMIACLAAAVNLLTGFNSGNFVYLFSIFSAVALALLGPGACSLDARVFGRRIIVISP